MRGERAKPSQSLMLLVAAGLVVPALVALAIWLSGLQEARRSTVEQDALDNARTIVALSDAEFTDNARLLAVLTLAGDWRGSEADGLARLAERVRRETDGWQAVVIRDAATGEVIHESADVAPDLTLQPLPAGLAMGHTGKGVFAEGRYCPCVVVHHRPGDQDVVATLFLAPQVFQDIVAPRVAAGNVAALVDREGRFLARTLDFDSRVGTPGTVYVRQAVAQGGEGFYEGRTFENLVNYTAYATSDLTGWSAHIAVDRSALDEPRTWSNIALAGAIVLALALAAVLLVYAVHINRARQRDEARLLELQKAEALSQFTGTVVHDFRNLLASVEAGLNLIRRGTAERQTIERADLTQQALDRGTRLINQLLSFARGDGAAMRVFDLRAMLTDIDDLVRRSLGDVRFHWSVDEDARLVRANRDQFELAVINLALNARDALGGAGEFIVAAHRRGEMVEIVAGDSGPGIPPNQRKHVFDPYFTTKPAGKGTGLGLAQVAGAVRQAGGDVAIEDRPGGGAQFVLRVPAGEAPSASDADELGEARS